ncbi:unnamed protein product [Brachionus calyciflorus]|uniref:Adenosine 3'-phospho 5'-phosphosulfate transporter 1 n=1 Tax=Brachionus calyciflorus TaxID=104777 RepID=A0A814Q3B4_9BILA|nr:unnamed protein product [Brachionus calyciflorus]
MQERIVKFSYVGSNGVKNKFKNSQFLVLSNRIAGLVLSFIIMIFFYLKPKKSVENIVSVDNWPPIYASSYSSLTNVLSSWFQYESLKYVSFSTQLLSKSCKSIFVMLLGTLISGTRYKPNEYMSVIMIGVGVFMFSDIGNLTNAKTSISTSLSGLACLLGYLITDSFTSTWQDDLIKKNKVSSLVMMFLTNVFSVLYTLSSLYSQNEFQESINFSNT